MKIKFFKTTYIRSTPLDLNVPPIGVVQKGTELIVDDQMVEGAPFEENPLWFKDDKGWFFWSGGAEVIEGPAANQEINIPDPEAVPKRQKVAWTHLENDPNSMNWGIVQHDLLQSFWQSKNLRGQGIKIALLDSGIQAEHPDLKEAIKGHTNLLKEETEDYQDLDGSGTHCAGVIAGRGNFKVFGVAPEAELYIGKVMNYHHQLDFEALLYGIKWASEIPVDIIFTSVNVPEVATQTGQLHSLQSLLDTLDNRGILLVAPVGESYSQYPENRLPASLTSCLSVGAHDQKGERMDSTATSTSLDLLAPGWKLLTTSTPYDTDLFTGSKAAAAYACGIAALLKQHLKQQKLPFSNLQITELLKETAYFPDPNKYYPEHAYGGGLINPRAALMVVDTPSTS